MKFKLGSWPYPDNTPAMLCWIKSPKQVGNDKQWMQKVLFIGKDNHFHERTLPWGMIPTLKLGEVYINGCMANVPSAGIERCFKLDGGATCRIVPIDSLKNMWLDKVGAYKKEFLWERCVLIESGSTRIWIPCIEIVRTFFAINKQMAHLLLEPWGLSRICTSEFETGYATLYFNRDIPATSLNQTVVTRIATILHEDHWRESWRQVWNRSIKSVNNSNAYSQLYCSPPQVRDTIWTVRGMPAGNDFFVFEIKGFRTADKLPFTSVMFSHPNLKDVSENCALAKGQGDSTDGGRASGGRSKFGEIGPDPAAPSGLSSPLRGNVTVSAIEFGSKIKVHKHFDTDAHPRKQREAKDASAEKTKNDSSECKQISMNAEAGIGVFRAAEFQPIEGLDNVPPGLRSFLSAVSNIPNAIVGCAIERVPDDSPLFNLGDGCRHFALAHIIGNQHDEGYALEIDSSDGLSLSTITFKPTFDTDGLTSAKKLLVKCLSKRGHWKLETIKEDITDCYRLAKHSCLEPKPWGCRLRSKVHLLNRKDAKSQQ